MEYLLENTPNQPTKFRTKNGLKQMMNHMERITLIVKLNLKLQCEGHVYVITVIHTYSLAEL